jgi:signal peptidase II
MHCPRAIFLFVILAAAGLTADLLSKHYVFKSMLADDTLPKRIESIQAQPTTKLGTRDMLNFLQIQQPVWGGVKFTLSTNPGVIFGLPMPRLVIAGATVLTLALVVYFFAASDGRAYWLQGAMALILGGALGNFYDRLLVKVFLPVAGMEPIRYHVRDFVDCSAVPLPFGFRYVWIFNVADVLLVIGVGILLIQWLAAPGLIARVQKGKRAR